MVKTIMLENSLAQKFIEEVKKKYPDKAYGYFLSRDINGVPDDFILFNGDKRNEWKDLFEDYGKYYIRNKDAGFLASEEEMYRIHKIIQERNKFIVGVFHSHKRHPPIFSKVDIDLHPSYKLWHLIISLRNVDMPQIKAFMLGEDNNVEELQIIYER